MSYLQWGWWLVFHQHLRFSICQRWWIQISWNPSRLPWLYVTISDPCRSLSLALTCFLWANHCTGRSSIFCPDGALVSLGFHWHLQRNKKKAWWNRYSQNYGTCYKVSKVITELNISVNITLISAWTQCSSYISRLNTLKNREIYLF